LSPDVSFTPDIGVMCRNATGLVVVALYLSETLAGSTAARSWSRGQQRSRQQHVTVVTQ
jgi:hypothetical protein